MQKLKSAYIFLLAIWILCHLVFSVPVSAQSSLIQEKINFSNKKTAVLVWWPNLEKDFWINGGWPQILKDGFEKRGYQFILTHEHSKDFEELISKSDTIIVACPLFQKKYVFGSKVNPLSKVYIWALESPLNLHQPIQIPSVVPLKKIFTWRTDLVDNITTFYIPVETRLEQPVNINTDPSNKQIFLIQIAGNHYKNSSVGAIYEKRRQATLWWLKNHPDAYEFYGVGWTNLLKDADKTLKKKFKSRYKGFTPDKIKTLSQAYYALAFENTRHPDYVSEKIYDVMKAGTVPIYLGAPNIEEFVPKDCFINYADFKNDEALYEYLISVTPTEYQNYLSCIQNFMASDKINSLTARNTGIILLKEIFE